MAPKPHQPLRTNLAIKALSIADTFVAEFEQFQFGGSKQRKAVLAVPEGQSTGGGAQAAQSISLVPIGGGPGILIAGDANPATMTANLRGFPYVDTLHQLRYGGRRLDIPHTTYHQFLEKAKTFFEDNGYVVTIINAAPESVKARYSQTIGVQAQSSSMWIVLVALLVVAGAIVVFLLL